MRCTKPRVRITAIGSLLADSNSRRSFKFPLSFVPLELITEKTAAASVEETIAPSKSAVRREKPKIT